MMREIEVVASGFRFPEGPAVGPNRDIYLVELAGGCVSRVSSTGRVERFADLGGSPNGAAFGPDGSLFVCNGGGRWAPERSTGGAAGEGGAPSLIQRVSLDGVGEDLVSEIDGVLLDSPNDLCFDPLGAFWFTDPKWPDEHGEIGPGAICWSDVEGQAIRAHVGLAYPNGLGVTPDGTALIVAESQAHRLVRFPIEGPGLLGEPEPFAPLSAGFPDGLCFDVEGRVYCAGHGAGAVFVYAPDGGEAIDVIEFEDRDVTNVCFAGEDMQWLYVTESDGGRLVRVRNEIPGFVLFPDRHREEAHHEG